MKERGKVRDRGRERTKREGEREERNNHTERGKAGEKGEPERRKEPARRWQRLGSGGGRQRCRLESADTTKRERGGECWRWWSGVMDKW